MEPIQLIEELRESMGMPNYARPDSPKQVWEETMREVRERLGQVQPYNRWGSGGDDREDRPISPSHTHSINSFEYELLGSIEGVRERIQQCEGRHVQQAIFSTYMDTLTQICFTERKIRSTILWEGNRSWQAGPTPEGQ